MEINDLLGRQIGEVECALESTDHALDDLARAVERFGERHVAFGQLQLAEPNAELLEGVGRLVGAEHTAGQAALQQREELFGSGATINK